MLKVGNHLEEEVRRLQLEERLNEATLETREERITQAPPAPQPCGTERAERLAVAKAVRIAGSQC